MAIAYVASSNVGAGAGTSATISKPTGTAENDVMLMAIYVEPASVTPSGTDIAAWTSFLSVTHPVYDMKKIWYWKRAGASEQASYAVTLTSATWRQLQIVTHSGCITSGSPIDASNSGTANDPATVVTATGINTTVDNAMLVMSANDWGAVTWATWSSPLTERLDTSQMAHASGIQTTAGASGNKSVTGSAGGHKIALLCALKPATGGTPITVADTITLGESISVTATLAAAESLALSDTPAVTATAPIGEGLTTGEAPALTVTLPVADGLTLAEALSIATGGTPITVAEGLGLGEGIGLSAQLGVAEGLSIAEALTALVQATVGDAFGVTDVATIVATLSMAEVATLGDGLVLAVAAPIGEAVSAGDSIAGAVILGLMETITTPEGVSVTTVGGLVITVRGPVRVTGGRGVRVTGSRGVRVTGSRGVRVTP